MSSSPREGIFEILSSVANIENALADAISVQTRIISKGNLKSDQLELFTNNLIGTIALSIKKELVLDTLLQDVIDAVEKVTTPQSK